MSFNNPKYFFADLKNNISKEKQIKLLSVMIVFLTVILIVFLSFVVIRIF